MYLSYASFLFRFGVDGVFHNILRRFVQADIDTAHILTHQTQTHQNQATQEQLDHSQGGIAHSDSGVDQFANDHHSAHDKAQHSRKNTHKGGKAQGNYGKGSKAIEQKGYGFTQGITGGVIIRTVTLLHLYRLDIAGHPQNKTFQVGTLTDEKMYEMLRKGQVEVSPEVRAQAQEDISEDGYWGIKQTSDRLFSFAKAISGGDSSKAETLIKAMEKGFKQATKSWGDDLPEICKKTLESATEKIRRWAKQAEFSDELADTAKDAFEAQAGTSALSE